MNQPIDPINYFAVTILVLGIAPKVPAKASDKLTPF